MRRFIFPLVIALTLAVSATSHSETDLSMSYDAERDRLSFVANDHHLLTLLNQIAEKSGIEIQASPSIDRLVSGGFDNLSAEAVIDKLSRSLSLNVIKAYHPQSDGQRVLVKTTFLRKGERSNPSVASLRDVDIDAMRYSTLFQHQNSLDKQLYSRDARWQARIDALPEAAQARYAKARDEQQAQEEAKELRRLERKTNREEKRKARSEKRKQNLKTKTRNQPSGPPPELRDAESSIQ